MTDIDTLLARLRTAAAEHASPQLADRVAVRGWPPAAASGARQSLLDAWASARSYTLAQFLVMDSADFVELAFLTYLGRSADPAGRGHYLGRLQQGTPRLEVLAEIAGSQEGVGYRGKAGWPAWLRPLLWGLRLPSAFARRVARGVLRRVERRLARRARGAGEGLAWRLAGVIEDAHQSQQRDLGAFSARMDALSSRADAHADSVAGRFAKVEQDLARALGASESLTERLARVQGDVARTAENLAATRALADGTAGRLSSVAADADAAAKALTALRARVAALDYSGSAPGRPEASAAPRPSIADPEITRYYLTLESVFRGDPERIRAQLATDYLQLLLAARADAGEGRCVDLGCGRGEWLDVLSAHGFDASGVDVNEAMAAASRARGHEVSVGDALAYLRALPDASVLAVTAFHVAEHLAFSTLFHVIAECRRVLKPRGLLILETPNPENIWVATHTFHHDPTHSQPLTPASLEFLVNHHGLETVAVLRLHPYPDEARLPGSDPVTERLNAMTCGGQDFAIVARKTPLAP